MPEFWPWDIDHPDHERFVREFWETYTDQAVHFAKIAEAEGVRLYSLGTETESLFRSRSGGYWPNDFGVELRAMIQAVRDIYSGLLTYDMHYGALTAADLPGSDNLWDDTDLDVIGVSAYFPLADTPPTTVLSMDELQVKWEEIFEDHLIPLRDHNPGRPIVFLEFGYTDSTTSPYNASADSFADKVFSDIDGNNLDDGEETQANIYQAFFNVMDRHPGVIRGAFLWDAMMSSNNDYAKSFARMRGFNVRWRLVEEVVRERYKLWR